MDFTNDVYKALNSYFNTISVTGYKKDIEVYKLLIFLYLETLLYDSSVGMVSEKDYNDIIKALYCIYGTSCMFPYPDYRKSYTDVTKSVHDRYRISEDMILRTTETGDVRTVI